MQSYFRSETPASYLTMTVTGRSRVQARQITVHVTVAHDCKSRVCEKVDSGEWGSRLQNAPPIKC